MFVPDHRSSSSVLVDTFGAYLLARLQAGPETADLFAKFDKVQESVASADERQRKARRAQQFAVAARDYAEFLVERLVANFHQAVLLHVSGNRESAVYLRYFPGGIHPLATMTLRKLIETVKVFEADLAGATDVVALKPWMQKFADQRVALEKAIAAYEAARVAHLKAQGSEVTERLAWQTAYRTVHAKLVELFPADRRKVESFFRAGRKARRKDASAEETKIIGPAGGREEQPAA